MQVRQAATAMLGMLLTVSGVTAAQSAGFQKVEPEASTSRSQTKDISDLLGAPDEQQNWADEVEVGTGACANSERNDSNCVQIRKRWSQTCQRVLTSSYSQIASIHQKRERFSEETSDPQRVRKLAEAGEIFEEDAKRALPDSRLDHLRKLAGDCLWNVALRRLDEQSQALAETAIALRVSIDTEVGERTTYANNQVAAAYLNWVGKKSADDFDKMVIRYNELVGKYNRLLADYGRTADAYNSLASLTRAYLDSQQTPVPRITFPQSTPQKPIHCSGITMGDTTSVNCW